MKVTGYFLSILGLIISLTIPNSALGETKSEDRIYLGMVTNSLPEKYAVIMNLMQRKHFLYREGDYINNEFKINHVYDDCLVIQDNRRNKVILASGISYKGIAYVESAGLSEFEYWYRLRETPKEHDFELVGIKAHKAILERDYKELELAHLLRSSSVTPSASNRNLKETAIDEIFFEQLKTKKMGPDVWIVDGKSVTKPVVESTAKALGGIAKGVRLTGFDKDGGPKLRFKTNVCTGMLDTEGFSVDSLSPDVREKAGFMPGDIIKSVNGKKVTSLLGLILLFFDIKKDSVPTVTVEILRNKQPRMLTYIIN